MWFNFKDCDKAHPNIWAPKKLEDVPEYYKALTDSTIKTFNFRSWGSFNPGDKVDVISDTIFNGQIIEIHYINPRKTGALSKGYYYVWKEFLVVHKDSVAECWKGYKRPSLFGIE
jgi:hypothetical protein